MLGGSDPSRCDAAHARCRLELTLAAKMQRLQRIASPCSDSDKELPGLSVFYKDADDGIYLTYATFARGLDALIGAHQHLDLTSEGRTRAYPLWPQRHDEYAAEA